MRFLSSAGISKCTTGCILVMICLLAAEALSHTEVVGEPRERASPSGVLHLRVVLLGDRRQTLYEGDHFPNLLVFVSRAECRHASHPDAVLRDPEQLAARPARHDVRQIGRLGIESLADVGRVLAWRAVAIDTSLVVEAESLSDLLLARLAGPITRAVLADRHAER